MTDYNLELDNFEGPMDLLLHLIKEKKKDIMDIDLLELTTQYIGFINKFREKLDVASEYLTIAAQLIEIKSKLILPKPEILIDSEYEAEGEREKLIRRLVEYKKFKEVSELLEKKKLERENFFVKAPMLDLSIYKTKEERDPNAVPEGLDIYQLMGALQKMYKRLALQKPLETKISHKEISTEDLMEEILEQLKIAEVLDFEKLFTKENFSKHYFVTAFLATLVLSRQQKLIIEQDENFGRIILKMKGEN